MSEFKHVPVLLQEAVDGLQVRDEGKYIDATAGGGGHTREIIARGGTVLAIDQDAKAVEYIENSQSSDIKTQKLVVARGNFRDLEKIADEKKFKQVDGVLFDLGVSSFQIDQSGRGFSLRRDEQLDMRMDESEELTALEVINTYSVEDLTEIFLRYGEEIKASQIVEKIVQERKEKKITSTQQLADVVKEVVPYAGDIHPATRVFQAVRIEVNHELDALRNGLQEACEIVRPGGRLVVISFHSLEDRIVKQTLRVLEQKDIGTVVTKKPIVPSDKEIHENKRARSAKMRIFEKI